jgi:hypothetical protein
MTCGGEINDTQPPVSKPNRRSDKDPFVIGPPIGEGSTHPLKEVFV